MRHSHKMGHSHIHLALALLLLTSTTAAADVTITVPAAIPSNEPQYADSDTFTSAVLNSTNFYRAEHNASDVSWNDTLAKFATDYLDDNGCKFEHSGGPYGENLAMGYPNATGAVEGWGDERDEYDFDRGQFSEETGHFTQLVWKNTTDVGCGSKLCGSKGWYLVCEYWPRGNVGGEYKDEVQKQVKDSLGAALVAPQTTAVVLLGVAWALLLV